MTRILRLTGTTSMIGAILTIGIIGVLQAQSYPDGARIYRVSAGVESRRINASQDEVMIGLARILLPKTRGWFKQDGEAGIQVTTRVSGRDSRKQTQTVSITQMYTVRVADYAPGLVSLPLEGTIIPSFALTDSVYTYSSLDMLVSLLKSRERTGFGSVIRGLAKLTAQHPFPTNPFTDGVRRLADLTTDLLADNRDQDNGIERRIPTAVVSLVFAPNAAASGSFLDSTGVFAIVFGSPDPPTPRTVDIRQTQGTCLTVSTAGTRALLISQRDTVSGRCTAAIGEIANPYLMFYVMAFATSPSASRVGFSGSDAPTPLVVMPSDSVTTLPTWVTVDLNTTSARTVDALLRFNPVGVSRVVSWSADSLGYKYSLPASNAILADYAAAIRIAIVLGLDRGFLQVPIPKAHAKGPIS